ncbi:response regulator transcription factor [Pseudomonas sp. MM211]|uniref:response regulator n=1 Tax=Pseudomonas sp. MM211 TaxID=2866808 RepID=UPI001CEC6295|nr:response regulator transcription factor [Pseudomonas sp. MM211]UCJ18595.1 response regulator transcription factor [Pseudomonas sp. MM211]
MNDAPIRLLVVDDHPLLREGIAAVLEAHDDILLVGEAADGLQAVERFTELRPDVTLMDLQMPGLNGTEAIQAIRRQFSDACIAVLTTYSGDARALQAVQAGARGYLLKSMLRKELVTAIRTLAAGKRYFPEPIASELFDAIAQDTLTARETQVLNSVAQGLGNSDIAAQLAISEDTVKGHMRSIMDKLKARNRTHAVAIAMQRGVIDAWPQG